MIPSIHVGEKKELRFFVNDQPPLPRPIKPVDLTLAASAKIYVRQNSTGNVSNYTGALVSTDPDPVNHYVSYTLLGSEFPTAEGYQYQVILAMLDGSTPRCDVTKISVQASLG